jgi:hypothetical protein
MAVRGVPRRSSTETNDEPDEPRWRLPALPEEDALAGRDLMDLRSIFGDQHIELVWRQRPSSTPLMPANSFCS